MLDHHHGGPVGRQGLEHPQQGLHVQRVQADGGLVEYKDGVVLGAAHLAGQLEALGFPAREARGLLAEGQVAQAQLLQHLQPGIDGFHVLAEVQRRVDVHVHQLGQGTHLPCLVAVPHLVGRPGVAAAPAVGAGDLHVGQELDVQTDGTGAVADRAAQAAGVVGEIPGLVAQLFGVGGAGVELAQFVVDVGVGGDGGPDVDPDGGGVDQLDLGDAGGLQRADVVRQGPAGGHRLHRGDQAFQHHGGLARARHPRHHRQPPLGKARFQRVDGVDGPGGKDDGAFCKQGVRGNSRPPHVRLPGQERPDLGPGVLLDVGHRPFGDDLPAAGAGLGAHLHQPVGLLEDLGVVVHQQHRVAVRHKVLHDAGQPHDVGRVQPDGRLVQHIEDAGGPVADGAGQLHPLALPRREGGGRPVQREVGQAQVHQAAGRRAERRADAFRHGAHLGGQGGGHAVHPCQQVFQGHLAGLVQPDAPQPGRAGRRREPGAAAVGAQVLFEELFHPLHPFFVLDLVQGVQDGVDGAVVGEIQLPGAEGVAVFGPVEDVLFDHRPVVDDLLFRVGQVLERHVGPHPHGPADVGHQGPHQAVPGGHRALVDGQGLIGHEGGAVHRAHRAGAAAGRAGPLAVEGQFLGRGREEMGPAFGADKLLPSGHRDGRRQIVPIGAPVAGQAGIHQPQAVQKLGAGAEGGADAARPRPLVQGQRRRHIQHLVHVGPGGLGHPPPGVGGQSVQVPPRPLGVQHPQRQAGLARPGHPRDAHDPVQRDIHVHVFQVVHPRAPDQNFAGRGVVCAHMRLPPFRCIVRCHCTTLRGGWQERRRPASETKAPGRHGGAGGKIENRMHRPPQFGRCIRLLL